MPIDPLNIPSGAGVNYGENDVRHLSEGDAMDVPGISGPTRNLAARDNALASKLNEVIAVVNNREQFVPLPVLRTTLPPNTEEIVHNYRIPPGFEARVLNAIVGSVPPSSAAEIDIYYANTFGNSTGQAIVSSSTEFTAGTAFFSSGELIITLKNRGGATLEIIASVLLTMRPIGSTSGVLLGSAAPPAVPGPPGPIGITGGKGDTGASGPAGTPGLVWQSTWNIGSTYSATDVVFWLGSSFKSKVASNIGNQPDISPSYWDYVAQQGASGFTFKGPWNSLDTFNKGDTVTWAGSTYYSGTTNLNHQPDSYPSDWSLLARAGVNGFRFRGAWNNPPLDGNGAYVLNDVVNIAISGTSQTFVSVADPPSPVNPPPNSDWNPLFSGPLPSFSLASVASTAYAESDFVPVNSDGQYAGILIAYPGTIAFNFNQAVVRDNTSGHGMCLLRAQRFSRWIGSLTIVLPGVAAGAAINWRSADVIMSVTSAGTIISTGTINTTNLTGSGTVTTAQNASNAGFPFTDAFSVPGYPLSVAGPSTKINQSGSLITITNPASAATNLAIGLVGFQTF